LPSDEKIEEITSAKESQKENLLKSIDKLKKHELDDDEIQKKITLQIHNR
jgi:hypothetical protein